MSKRNLGHNKQRTPISAFLSFLCLTFLAMAAAATPPANDNCSNAWPIPGSGPFPYLAPAFEITDATSVGDPTNAPDCQTNVLRSVWYRFTPTNSEFYTFSTCPDETTVSDTVIAIYTNALGCSPTTFSLVACVDDTAGGCLFKAVLTSPLVKNTPYYIVVWQYGKTQITPGNAFIKLVVSKTMPPWNDTCQNAQYLTLNLPVFGSTLAAINDYETTPECFTQSGLGQKGVTSSGRDVVYTFTAPETDTYSVKVYEYDFDNDLVVYATSFCPSAGPTTTFDTVVGAANRVRWNTAEELFCMPLEAGQQIYIFVDEDIAEETPLTAGSTFRIEVNRCRLELANNHTPEVASPLPCGVEGALRIPSEDNYFALGTFPVGSRAFVLIDSSATSPTDFALQIRTNTVISTNLLQHAYANNHADFGANAANIAGTILPPLPTFVRVFNPAYSRYGKEPYRLYAVVQPPIELASSESEPNNSYADANSAANNYFRGTLPTTTDQDAFRITANGGDLLFVSLDCDPLRDKSPIWAKLELLDADGKPLFAVDTHDYSFNWDSSTNIADNSPRSPAASFVYRVADEGEFDFFVRVSVSPSATGPVASGDYLLSLSKNCFPGSSGANTPPSLGNFAVTTPVNEGDTAVLSGTITDPDTGEGFTLTINWGDGSDVETITPGAGVYNFSIPHLYADNASYPINLMITDQSGASIASNTVAVVNNAAPSNPILQLSAATIFENDSVTLDGSFTDAGLLDTHTVSINWGDGSSASTLTLAVGETMFAASHSYLDDNPTATPWDTCTISVTVTDNSAGSANTTIPIVVSNLPPVFTSASLTPSSIAPNSTATLTASFTDVGPRDIFSYSVNWADGSLGVMGPLIGNTLNLFHNFTVANTNLSVQLTIFDDDGGSISTTLPINIQMPVRPQLTFYRTNGDEGFMLLEGTPSVTYRLQSSTNLPFWNDYGPATLNNVGILRTYITNILSPPPRFFRAVYP